MIKPLKVLRGLFVIGLSLILPLETAPAFADQYESSGSKFDLGMYTPKMAGAYGDGVHDDYVALNKWATSGKPLYCDASVYLTSKTVKFLPLTSYRDSLNLNETPPQTWNFDSGCEIRSIAPMRATCEFGSLNPQNPSQYFIYSGRLEGGDCNANGFAMNAISVLGFNNFTIDNSVAKDPLLNYLSLGDVNGPFSSGAIIRNFQTIRSQSSVQIASVTTGSTTIVTTTTPHGMVMGNHKQVVYLENINGTNHTGNCSLGGTNSALNCMQFTVTVTGTNTFILNGVTTVPGDWAAPVSGQTPLAYINFSGSIIPIPLVSVSQSSPAVFTCATACNVQPGKHIVVYGNFGSTYTDSLYGFINGIDGSLKVATTPTANTFTAYQHEGAAINTLTASTTGKAGVMIEEPIGVAVSNVLNGTSTVVDTGIGVGSVVLGTVGSGYSKDVTATVSPPPTGGVQAQVIPFESNGVVSLSLVAGGTCTSGSSPTLEFDGGGGGGAQGTVTLTGTTITAVALTASGNSYNTAPAPKIIGGNCTGVEITATISGVVYGYYVSVQGSGYITPPTITITDSTGIGATASTTLSTGNTFQAGDWVVLESVVGDLDANNVPVAYGIYQVGSATSLSVTLPGLNTYGATAYISGGILMPYPGRPLYGVYNAAVNNTAMFDSTVTSAAIGIGGPVGSVYNTLRPYDMQLSGNHLWGYPTTGNMATCYDIGGGNKLSTNMCDGPFNFGIRAWAEGNEITTTEFDVATFGVGNTAACMRAEAGSRNTYQGNGCQAPYANDGWQTQCQGAPCNVYLDISTAYLDPSMYVINNPIVWQGGAIVQQPFLSTIISGGNIEEDFNNPLGGTTSSTSLIQYAGFFSITSTTNSMGFNVPAGQDIFMSFDYASQYAFSATGANFGNATGGSYGPGTVNALEFLQNGVPLPSPTIANFWEAPQTFCDIATNGYGLQIAAEVGYAIISTVNSSCNYAATAFYFPSTGTINAEEPFVVNAGIRSGASGNTDTTGTVVLSGGTYTLALTGTYATRPNCFAWDVTTYGTLAYAVASTTNIVFHGTGTDAVSYHCIGLN